MTLGTRLATVVRCKMSETELFGEGNEAFVDEKFEEALQKYSKAIELNSYNEEYYIKRAAAFTKLGNYKAAVADADSAISLKSTKAKAYFRKGIALFHLRDFQSAKETFLAGLDHDRDNKDMTQWLTKCDAELDNKKEESLLQNNAEMPVSTATKEAATSSPQADMAPPPKPKYDWYQTETHVIITLMVKNVKAEDVNIDYREQTLNATVRLPSGSDYSVELDLPHCIVADQCKTRIMSTKIELKLKKKDAGRWSSLESDQDSKFTRFPSAGSSTDNKAPSESESVHRYPTSQHVVKDWDKLEAQLVKEEKDETLEGDAALNKLFQQIYGDGSEEVRRAMNKSFVESGGTVLSTNWGEVKKEKVVCKPPDGMELKKWS